MEYDKLIFLCVGTPLSKVTHNKYGIFATFINKKKLLKSFNIENMMVPYMQNVIFHSDENHHGKSE